MLKRTVAPGSMFAVVNAWRSEPAPESPVCVTTRSVAGFTVSVTVTALLLPRLSSIA